MPSKKSSGKGKDRKSKGKSRSRRRIVQVTITWILIFLGQAAVFLFLFFEEKRETPAYRVADSMKFTRTTENFGWYVFQYFYFQRLGKKDYDTVFAALAFFLWDFFVEIWNALFLTKTNFSAPWVCNLKRSSYQIMIGWNIEIVLNFLIVPLAIVQMLPKDKEKAYFGINSRVFWTMFFSCLHFGIEGVLNYFDALIWNYWWWSHKLPILPFLTGYMPFYLIAFNVYDAKKMSTKIAIVGILALITIPSCAVFMSMGWI